MKLNQYMQDGAGHQARAVLAFLQSRDGIEESWNESHGEYEAHPKVARWENCREQGYVVTMRGPAFTGQINIAFFEHRNSDSICAVKWLQRTINSPTIDTADFQGAYETSHDVSHSVGYGKVDEMANWIFEQLTEFWTESMEVTQ